MKWIGSLLKTLSERNTLLAQVETLRAQVETLRAQVAKLQSQLPLGMHDCTIFVKECEVGHVSLSAKNWVQHPCSTCKIDKLKTLLKQTLESSKKLHDLYEAEHNARSRKLFRGEVHRSEQSEVQMAAMCCSAFVSQLKPIIANLEQVSEIKAQTNPSSQD
jgi:hypothetical protein